MAALNDLALLLGLVTAAACTPMTFSNEQSVDFGALGLVAHAIR